MSGYQNDAGVTQQEAGFGFAGRFWTESFNDGMTATPSGTQANSKLIDSMFCRFATVTTAADGALLPPVGNFPGGCLSICVINSSANAMQVFAQGSDTINSVAGVTGVPQMGNSVVWYTCTKAGTWLAQGLGSGFSGSNPTYSYADALTANSGGVQTGATPITTQIARFTTVAGAGYSAVLPVAAPGLDIIVINAGANIMTVWPAGTDQINNLGASNAFALPVGGVATFVSTVAGQWHTILSAAGAAQQAYTTASSAVSFTASGANISGGSVSVFFDLTGTLGSNQALTLPTVAALVAALTVAGLNPQPGMTYELEICYRNGTNTWTVTTNTGWTLNNTMTITGAGVTRKFIVALTSLTAASLTSIGTYTVGVK